jgi:glycine/D-amino acid oxidase-like deaminating enzyme
MQVSYWEQSSFLTGYDTIIIGAGIVGISAALSIKELEPKNKVLVIERGFLPSGASTKNAGFACFGSASELLEDFTKMGEDATFELVERRYNGLLALRQRVPDDAIDFKKLGNFEVFKNSDLESFEKCHDALPYLNKNLESITSSKTTFSNADHLISKFGFDKVSHLVWNNEEGQIDTGKMMKTLLKLANLKNIDIYFGADVRAIEDDGTNVALRLQSDMAITTKKVLVATNGFAAQLLPELKVYPARNQVLVTHPYKKMLIQACFHYDRGYYYWREINGRILVGGGRNLYEQTESTDILALNDNIQNYLTNMLKDWITPHEFPGVDLRWSGILGLGEVKYPIIKNVSTNVTVSVRMGGMGVALGTLAGNDGAKLLLNPISNQATEI